MDTFRQISTELLPWIHVENWFRCSISHIFWPIVFQLCIGVDIFKRSGLRWLMGKFCQISTELLPLIDVKNGFNALSSTFFG